MDRKTSHVAGTDLERMIFSIVPTSVLESKSREKEDQFVILHIHRRTFNSFDEIDVVRLLVTRPRVNPD